MAAPTCPKCGSKELVFVEHATTVTIYKCGHCGHVVALAVAPR